MLWAVSATGCSKKLVSDERGAHGGSTTHSGGQAGISGNAGGSVGVIVLDLDAGIQNPTPPTCTGTDCALDPCPGKPRTTIKGTVYDPAGVNPLYNVMVYVPTTELDPIVDGPSCLRCDGSASGRPIATALSDASGKFTLNNVPAGTSVPVVIQTGKWRRKIFLPEVKACQANEFTDQNTFRLPRNQTEGHLPKIAVTLGKVDCLECLLRRIGIADSEFTNPEGTGRVNLYYETGVTTAYASGAPFPSADILYTSLDILSRYDMVLLSCHGEVKNRAMNQATTVKHVFKDYADKGGRVFASHYFYSFFRGQPGTDDASSFKPTPFPVVATEWDGYDTTSYDIEMGFPKGLAFADWLVNVGASQTKGIIELDGVESPAKGLNRTLAQPWIYKKGGDEFPYFSLGMPTEKAATPDEQCGRFVHTGIHVTLEKDAQKPFPFPDACRQGKLTPQELALEFLIFDLSACMIRNDEVPTAPPVIIF